VKNPHLSNKNWHDCGLWAKIQLQHTKSNVEWVTIERTQTLSLILIVILTLVLSIIPTTSLIANPDVYLYPNLCTPKLYTSQKSSSLYCYVVYTSIVHPDQSISMQCYVQVFASYRRLLPVFPLSWQKYFLPWQKPHPGTKTAKNVLKW